MYRRKSVLITGFIPSDELKQDPSWDGVKCINLDEIQNKYNIELTLEGLRVSYEEVDVKIPRLWRNVQPDLTIHVGASDAALCFILETQAKRGGYTKDENNESGPLGAQNVCKGPDTLVTQLDVATMCRRFNRPEGKLHAKMSSAAGLSHCEYVYYTSLSCGRNPTLLVHVPVTKYTSEELAQGLERILELCLKQLSHPQDDLKNDIYNVV